MKYIGTVSLNNLSILLEKYRPYSIVEWNLEELDINKLMLTVMTLKQKVGKSKS